MNQITGRRASMVMAILGISLMLGLSFPAQADFDQTPKRKLGRGISNIFLCWYEIPRSWTMVKKEHGEVAGLSWGTIQGGGRMFHRLSVGFYEVFTFPRGEKPLVYPEFVISEQDTDRYRVRKPNDIY